MGRFVVISGPSAVGKTTVMKELLRRVPHSGRIVTTTTRAPRQGEIDGRDYHFVSRDDFRRLVARGRFLEHVETYGNCYGATLAALDKALQQYEIVFAVLDPRGARALMKRGDVELEVVFLMPGTLDDLRRRLTERGGDVAEAEFTRRLAEVEEELVLARSFHHLVRNEEGKLEGTLQAIGAKLGLTILPAS